MLRGDNISFSIGGRFLLSQTSLLFDEGMFHVIMGANGAGKSTLLKILAGNQKPSSGKIFLEKKEIGLFTKAALARYRAVLSQHYHVTFPILVKDLVLMGRYPHYKNNPSRHDRVICSKAMEWMQVEALGDRDYNTLSGGEAQKVQMSRVLAQIWPEKEGYKKILFLDEPVSHLDLKFQHQLLQVAKDLSRMSVTVIAVLHDINLALSFADRILFMKSGSMVYDISDPGEVTAGIIHDVYGVHSQILQVGESGRHVVVF